MQSFSTYGPEAREAAFLLGGIGTGNISMGARGELRDFEIYGHADKGFSFPYTFFTIRTRAADGAVRLKILESRLTPPFAQSHGFYSPQMAGIPRFQSSRMRSRYPFVNVELIDAQMPVKVEIEAFTPFVPRHVDDSSIPGFVVRYRATNTTDGPVDVTIAGSLTNMTALTEVGRFGLIRVDPGVQNAYRQRDGISGIHMTCPEAIADVPGNGSLAITTAAEDVTYTESWLEGGWWDGAHYFIDDLTEDGRLDPHPKLPEEGNRIHDSRLRTGSLGIVKTLAAGETHVFEFAVTWSFPYRYSAWEPDLEALKRKAAECGCGDGEECDCGEGREGEADACDCGSDCGCGGASSGDCGPECDCGSDESSGDCGPDCDCHGDTACDCGSDCDCGPKAAAGASETGSTCGCGSGSDGCGCGCGPEVVRNYYSLRYPDAWSAATDLLSRLPDLEARSRTFADALYATTLPAYVIEALADNITVLRSTTCFRIENGAFLGWEGCHDGAGCCPGTCTHVWNYAQTLAFLFPELERSMRESEFLLETNDEGSMAFRGYQVLGEPRSEFLPATDGQLGAIVRVYREWKLSGDEDFLRRLWPAMCRAMDFSIRYWDSDGDFVLDSQQHNTYDIEFYGITSMTNTFFLAALKAMGEMAAHLGDEALSARYLEGFRTGSANLDRMLWDGKHYPQRIEDVNAYKYQYGKGVLSDQLVGQYLAHVAGLGYVLPEEHVKVASETLFRSNFRESLADHVSVQRTYALNDEPGLLICSWPDGGRPRLPFVYCDEVWTGIEYQVAAELIFDGHVDEGLRLVEAVRSRHDGIRRNPWNEVECGHHYARSMASWAVLVAMSGYRVDAPAKAITFQPRVDGAFRCFFSAGDAWGIYTRDASGAERVEVLDGSLAGYTVNGKAM